MKRKKKKLCVLAVVIHNILQENKAQKCEIRVAHGLSVLDSHPLIILYKHQHVQADFRRNVAFSQ